MYTWGNNHLVWYIGFYCHFHSEWPMKNDKKKLFLMYTEMQLIVGPVGPKGQNFRGSSKWRLCVRPNDRQTFLLLGGCQKSNFRLSWLPLRPLSEGSLIIVNKVKSHKQIGKNFCSFLFMLNFGNQFPFRIFFVSYR
jgi:hypothetical protein